MEERQEGSLSLTNDSSSFPSWSIFEHHHIVLLGYMSRWHLMRLRFDLTSSRGCLSLFYRWVCVCVCWKAGSGLAKQNNWLETSCKLFLPYDPDRPWQGNHLESQEAIQAWGNKNMSWERLQRPQLGSRVETQPIGSSRTCFWFTAKNREVKFTPGSEEPCPEMSWCHHWAGKQERGACLWETQ